ncbi:hypothetical protein [Streptomyces laculatispora]|nr:hypothetical protein [Streptomyces laculatispora]MBO0916298.1 hypothetical protein [Streptomyces laculatispora]
MSAAHTPMPSEDDCWEAFWDVLAAVVVMRHETGSSGAKDRREVPLSR